MRLLPHVRRRLTGVTLLLLCLASAGRPLRGQTLIGPNVDRPPQIDPTDTNFSVDVTISNTVTQVADPPVIGPQGPVHPEPEPPSQGAASTSAPFSFHLAGGFDPQDHLILHLAPQASDSTSWPGAQLDIASIVTVNDAFHLYDAFGSEVPFNRPAGSPETNALSMLAPFVGLNITAGLVTQDPHALVGDGTIEEASTKLVRIANRTPAPGSEITVRRTFVPGASAWVMKKIEIEEIARAPQGSTRRLLTFAFGNLHWAINESEDARRAALAQPLDDRPTGGADNGNWSPLGPVPAAPAAASEDGSVQMTQSFAFGQNLVLQHGFLSDEGTWQFMDPWLSDVFLFGTKLVPGLPYRQHIDTQAAMLGNEIQASGKNDFLIVAHSNGGLVGRRAAQDRPDLVRGVVTFGTPHNGVKFLAVGQEQFENLLVDPLVDLTGLCNVSFTACFIADAILTSFVDVLYAIVLDQAAPVLNDVTPGSGFLAELNSTPEPFVKVGIENTAFKRWLEMRLLGDAICDDQGQCLGPDLVFYTDLAYIGFRLCELIAFFECIDCIQGGGISCTACDVGPICGRIAGLMDTIDERFNQVVSDDSYLGLPFFGGDSIVSTSGQLYPGANARYAILGGPSHIAETKSPIVRDALVLTLDQQFQVPRQGTGFPVPAITALDPSTVTVGGDDLLLTVFGTGFGSFSTLQVDGQARLTAYQSQDQTLTTTLTRADIDQVGTLAIAVRNPEPGGGLSNSRALTVAALPANPVPVLSSLEPASVAAGPGGTVLTLEGLNFVEGVVARIGNADRGTLFHSPSELIMQLQPGDLTAPGTRSIVAVNPGPGGGPSNALPLEVTSLPPANPVPVATGLAPTAVEVGSGPTTLNVLGSGFVAGSVIEVDQVPRATTFVSANQVSTLLAASLFATTGFHQVTVANPTPGGGRSVALTLEVTSGPPETPEPVLTSLSPSSAFAGSPQLTLTVEGSGFAIDAVVRWEGSNRETIFISPAQLRAIIPASDLEEPGTADVKVRNPGESPVTSDALQFAILEPPPNPDPAITSVAPSSIPAGSPATELTVLGSGFVPASSARWNGDPRTTVYVSATELRATLSAPDLAAMGSGTLKVRNPAPGGGNSNTVTVTITAPLPSPVPAISSIAPTEVFAGGPDFILIVDGSGFVPASRVRVDGSGRETTYVSATQLLAVVPAADIEDTGPLTVRVRNPEPGGGNSNTVTLNVQPNPLPSISSISPSTVAAGGPNFTLVIEGQGFVPSSVVKVGGATRATVFVSPTRLQATVLSGDIQSPGPVNVKVKNPEPGGGTSNTVQLNVQ